MITAFFTWLTEITVMLNSLQISQAQIDGLAQELRF